MGTQLLNTGVYGPLPQDTFGLIIGRASSSLQGIQVFPEVTDNDYTGQIRILASSGSDTISLQPGTLIAQLLLFPLQQFNARYKTFA